MMPIHSSLQGFPFQAYLLSTRSWKCAEGSTSYQASLEASQQHLKEVKETMETAKDAVPLLGMRNRAQEITTQNGR